MAKENASCHCVVRDGLSHSSPNYPGDTQGHLGQDRNNNTAHFHGRGELPEAPGLESRENSGRPFVLGQQPPGAGEVSNHVPATI